VVGIISLAAAGKDRDKQRERQPPTASQAEYSQAIK
jgi:hypothetical protein